MLASQLRFSQSVTESVNSGGRPDLALTEQQLRFHKATITEVSAVALLDSAGQVLLSTDPEANTFTMDDEMLRALQTEPQNVLMDLTTDGRGETTLQLFYLMHSANRDSMVVAAEVELFELADLVEYHVGLGYTEETMLLYAGEDGAAYPIVPLKFQPDMRVQLGINPFQDAALSRGIGRYTDYRGKEVVALSKALPNTNWMLVFKIDTDEALAIVERQREFLVLSLLVATILVLVIAIVFSRSLTRPLSDLTQVALMIASGDLKRRIRWATKDELGVLALSFNTMADKLIRANSQLDNCVKEKTKELAIANEHLAKANRDLEKVTLEDALTKVANRRAFDVAFFREWKRSSRSGMPLSLLMIDVDFFKRYNDNLGHHAGDDCLVHVANVLKRICQRDNDMVARYGGEEFVLLLPETPAKDCENVARRIVQAFAAEQIPHPDSPVASYVTVSVGFSTHMPPSQLSARDFLQMADAALYEAKSQGRNRYQALFHHQRANRVSALDSVRKTRE